MTRPLRDSEIEKRIAELQANQTKSESRLERTLSRLDGMNNAITIKTNFIGLVNGKSIEEALKAISTNTATHFEAHYEGISSLFEHLNCVLSLIQMISSIETDLYHLLEEESSSVASSLDYITTNISDSDLRTSKQILGAVERIIILRDRLNALHNEINNLAHETELKINNLISDFDLLNKRNAQLQDELKREIEALCGEILLIKEEFRSRIEAMITTNKKELATIQVENRRNKIQISLSFIIGVIGILLALISLLN